MKAEDIVSSDPLSWWFPYILAILVGIITCIRSYIGGQDCTSKNRLDGKTILITGGSGGIAKEIAKDLITRGAKIILACKNLEKGEQTKNELCKLHKTAYVTVKKIDLSSIKSIRHFVSTQLGEYRTIDILINNAGIAYEPYKLSEDGFEMHLAVNYLGHFLLIHLLLSRLKAANGARIINISGDAHRHATLNLNDLNMTSNWDSGEAFSQSKLCLVLMSKHLAKTLEASKITINAVSPGLVRGTGHLRNSPLSNPIMQVTTYPWMWLLLRNARQGAQSIIYAAVDVKLDRVSGRYISNCEIKEHCEKAKGNRLPAELYDKTCELLNITPIKI